MTIDNNSSLFTLIITLFFFSFNYFIIKNFILIPVLQPTYDTLHLYASVVFCRTLFNVNFNFFLIFLNTYIVFIFLFYNNFGGSEVVIILVRVPNYYLCHRLFRIA